MNDWTAEDHHKLAEERVLALLYECTVKLLNADDYARYFHPDKRCRAEIRAIRDRIIRLMVKITRSQKESTTKWLARFF